MKSLIKLSLFSVALASAASAATVTVATTGSGGDVAGGNARAIFDLSGAALPAGGGFTAVGYFTGTADSNFFATTDPLGIEASFNQLGGSGTFGVDIGGGNISNGLFSLAGSEAITASTNADFIGQGIYAVIGNGSSIATSSELLVILSPNSFAVDNPAFNSSLNLQAGEGTVVYGSNSFDGSGSVIVNAAGSDFFGAANSYQTAALVPEPSIAILGALGFLGLARRRR